MSYQAHQQAGKNVSARCAIITMSDTRTPETDKSGAAIRRLLEGAGHAVAAYAICRDDPAELEPLLSQYLADSGIDCIVTNGGTGISRRDRTIRVIESSLTQLLPGFGELFRMLSWQEIGSGAMLSRATGGIASGKPLFALPGSTKAVELAMTKLILPELGHLLAELRK